MAHTARADLSSSGILTIWRVACVARGMSRKVRWNRESETAIDQSSVATVTSSLWFRGPIHVLEVIKLYVEAFLEAGRKTSERRFVAAGFSVTDLAHRNRRSGELSEMAGRACTMSRKAWCW